MKNILLALWFMALTAGFSGCAKVAEDIAGPAEPAQTDTLENRVEPQYLEDKYNPEIEEEIESDEMPLETQEDEDAPLIK
ncbi:MAG: hypothetical protein RIG61_10675 [Deltaproteobacteria bacterium]